MATFALLIRLYHLKRHNFWVDELFTLKALDHVRSQDAWFLFQDLHGPLYTAFAVILSFLVQGEGLRIISAIAGAATVIPMTAWGRRVGGEGLGAWLGLLTALSPFMLWYSQELRNYSFLMFFSACFFLAIESWREGKPGRAGFLGFVLSAWLGLLSNLTFLLLLMAAGVSLLAVNRGQRIRTLGRLVLAAMIILVLTLPWVISFTTQMAPQRLVVSAPAWDEAPLRGETTFSPLAIPYTIFSLLVGYSYGPSLPELHWGTASAIANHLPAILIAGLIMGGAILLGLKQLPRRRGVQLLLIIAITLGLASFLAMKNFKVYNVRYVSMVLPALLLMVAFGSLKIRKSWLRATLSISVVLLFLISMAQHFWNPDYSKEDCRLAAEVIVGGSQDEDLIVVAIVSEPFKQYYQGSSPVVSLWPGQGREQIASKLDLWGRPEKIKLVSAREWEWGDGDQLLLAFSGYQTMAKNVLTGVTIYELHKLK
jgi:hypothetical protein